MNRLILGCTLLAVSWVVWADDTDTTPTTPKPYKVEVIVFENLDPNALQAENWPADPGMPSLDNAMELETLPAFVPPEVEPVPDASTAPATEATSVNTTTTDTHTTVPSLTALPSEETPTAPDSALMADANAVEPPAEPEIPVPSWRWMTESEYSLNQDEQKLLDSGHYRPLLHIGWVQPLDETNQGIPVHLYDGLKPKEEPPATTAMEQPPLDNPLLLPSDEPGAAAPAPEENPAPLNADATTSASEQPEQTTQPPHILDGSFTLRKGRFLHVDVDLDYRIKDIPVPPLDGPATEDKNQEDTAAQPVATYVRMVQSRRIRDDELHYLDHPLFGVLFMVSPLPEPTPDPETSGDTKSTAAGQ